VQAKAEFAQSYSAQPTTGRRSSTLLRESPFTWSFPSPRAFRPRSRGARASRGT
jgi:hypothetical protein